MPGYKVCVDSPPRSDLQNVQIGIFADSLEHLKKKVQENLNLQGPVSVYLEDGTLVCDEDYFKILEPQTKLRIRTSHPGQSLGQKRSCEEVVSFPPAKRGPVFAAPQPVQAPVPFSMPMVQQFPHIVEKYYPQLNYQPGSVYVQQRPLAPPPYIPEQPPPNLTLIPRPALAAQPWQQPIQAVENTAVVPRTLLRVQQVPTSPPAPRRQAPPLIHVENTVLWTGPAQDSPTRTVTLPQAARNSPPSLVSLPPATFTMPQVSLPTTAATSVPSSKLTPPQRPVPLKPQALPQCVTPCSMLVRKTSGAPSQPKLHGSSVSKPLPQLQRANKSNNNNSLPTTNSDLVKLVSQILNQQAKAGVPSDLHLRKSSVDEGYDSGCTNTTPSPSTPQSPVSITKAETTLLPRMSTLTDMLANQPISDILKADLCTSEDKLIVKQAKTGEEKLRSVEPVEVVDKEVEIGVEVTTEPAKPLVETYVEESIVNKEPHSSPVKSLSVSIPVVVKNGQIRVRDGAKSVATTVFVPDFEIITIDSDSEDDPNPPVKVESTIKEEPADTNCEPEASESCQVTVAEYASEEIALTSLPQCTVGQVHQAVASLFSVALKEGQMGSLQTKSEIESLLSTVSKEPPSTEQTVLLESSTFEYEEHEYIDVTNEDLHSMITEPKDAEVQVSFDEVSESDMVVCDVGNEVTVSNDMDALSESGALAAFLTNEIQVEEVYPDPPEHTTGTLLQVEEVYPDPPKHTTGTLSQVEEVYPDPPKHTTGTLSQVEEVYPDPPKHTTGTLSPISTTIDSLLVHADSLSEADSSIIRGFLSGAPTDPRQKSKTFPIRRLENRSILSLRLNFSSGEWQGCVVSQNSLS